MKHGVVIGDLWATRKAPGLGLYRLKLVAMIDSESQLAPEAQVVVAIDTLGARNGQRVLVSFGSGGRNVLRLGPHNREVLCDAAIALLIEPVADEAEAPAAVDRGQ